MPLYIKFRGLYFSQTGEHEGRLVPVWSPTLRKAFASTTEARATINQFPDNDLMQAAVVVAEEGFYRRDPHVRRFLQGSRRGADAQNS
jgi:hypothetical protein